MSTEIEGSGALGRSGIENILRLYADGMTSGDIARKIGMEEWAISLIIKLEGV